MLESKGIITNLQKRVLTVFSQIPDSPHFYLTGGTALSNFYLGHRLSYDLDFFTSESDLIPPFSNAMQAGLEKSGFSVTAVRKFQTFAEFKLTERKETTTIHLAYDSPFRFSPPVDSVFGVKVNDYTDIIIDKLLTLFGRAEPRDAVDLFFILKKEDFWKLLELAPQKDPGFDLYWLAVAFEKVRDFPDEIEQWPVDMLVEVNARELKSKFLTLAAEIMDKIKGIREDRNRD
ncbi:MAG: nucleotidyl transferase AbiEii/AbiGii toxin family protein [candidate division KSB1 bacterium]|nr:nucleotidyl transferase AbiEii/AbiGii toxin family protein [candidate division KSB1 bacterium]